MEQKLRTPRPEPVNNDKVTADDMVNDSMGTINPSDSSGVDEEKETGDAKDKNFPTKED